MGAIIMTFIIKINKSFKKLKISRFIRIKRKKCQKKNIKKTVLLKTTIKISQKTLYRIKEKRL